MKTSSRLNAIACLVIAGCIAPSFAARKPQLPLIPGLQELMMRRQAHQSHPSATGAPRLAKRTAPGTASISGTVTLPDTPVTYINPKVSVIDTFGWEVANPECDDSGTYRVTGLYPGAYLVMAFRDYSAEYSGDSSDVTYLGNTGDLRAARWIHLTNGQSLTGQDIAIPAKALSNQPRIIISGTCYEGPGTAKPLSSVSLTVTVATVDNNLLYLTTKSDNCRTAPDGSFACTLATAPGSYYGLFKAVSISSDTAFVPQWWDGSAVTAAEPAAISLGPSTTGKEIHFTKGGTISGVIVDEISDTLLDYVYVHALDKDGYEINSAYCSNTWHDTTFSISGLPEGSWYLEVTSGYSSPYGTTYYPQVASLENATAVNVTTGNSTQVRIVLKRQSSVDDTGPMGFIKGRITREDNGAPVPDYGVQFTSGSYLAYSGDNTETDSLGNYADSLPADSSYYVYTGNEMFVPVNTPEYYLTQTWYPGVTDQASAVKVKISRGSTQTVDIAVQQGGSIGGWVRTSTGAGLPDFMRGIYNSGDLAYGYAWNDDFSNVYSTYIGGLSGFRFCGVRPGTYSVRFMTYNYNYFSGTGGGSETSHAFTTAEDVVVTKDNTVFKQTLTIPEGSAVITGTAETSNPLLYGSFIYCYSADSIMAGYSASTFLENMVTIKDRFFNREVSLPAVTTHTDFSIGKLVPGKYAVARLTIDTPAVEIFRQWYGTATWEKFNLREMKEYYRQFLKPAIPAVSWITLAAGETRSGVNFSNIGTRNPAKSNRAGNGELRILHGTSRNVALHYCLPEFDGSKPAVLAIYSPDGAQIETIRLAAPHGTATWDGKNHRGAPVSSGVYVYRLTNAGHVVTVKGAWVR